jgi:hypothetical protein
LFLDFGYVVRDDGQKLILMQGDKLGEDVFDDLSVGERLKVGPKVL